MSEYFIFTIFFAAFISVAAVLLNHRFSMSGANGKEKDSLSSWKGWQLSFMLRIGGLLIIFILLSFLQESGSIDRHFFEKLVFISFSILVVGLLFDLFLSLHRLNKNERPKTTEGVKI